jgi:hypothetical protein
MHEHGHTLPTLPILAHDPKQNSEGLLSRTLVPHAYSDRKKCLDRPPEHKGLFLEAP